jgi:hypothetical protein
MGNTFNEKQNCIVKPVNPQGVEKPAFYQLHIKHKKAGRS